RDRLIELSKTVPYAQIAVLAPTNAVAREIERRLRDGRVPTFLPRGDYDEAPEAVFVSTIHQAKGLEWSAVFVASFEDGVLPFYDIEPEDKERYEEARRLAYVAVTRAKHSLFVSHSAERGGHRKRRSPFVKELLQSVASGWVVYEGAYATRAAQTRAFVKQQSVAPKKRRPKRKLEHVEIGALAGHSSFGTGRVIAIEGEKITVDFKFGRKTILQEYLKEPKL
ncbi:MAG: 3'-5' exonuclease, partial [Myxococcota bacterium]